MTITDNDGVSLDASGQTNYGSLDVSFVKSFEAEVHSSFQRIGSKLKSTVRNRNDVKGLTTTFQKVGRGVASSKIRNGNVPIMNLSHEPITIELKDYYAGDWVDSLDELKINHDEKLVIANAGAYTLGRKTDELIINSLENETDEINIDLHDENTGLTKEKILNAFEILGSNDVPDDNERYAVVGWKQWSELMNIPEFSNSEYVGENELPWNGTQVKRWLGTLWIPHSGLIEKDGVRNCYWYHKTAIGHATFKDVSTDITWHGDKAAYFINNMMSQGAGVIDKKGLVRIACAE